MYLGLMLQDILSLLFPSPCLSCGYLGEPLCKSCFRHIVFSPHVREIDNMKVLTCMYYQPDSILERLIKPFKYSHQANIFKVFVPYMNATLKLMIPEPNKALLVPVPLYKSRELERGYNQAALLAKWIARFTGGEFSPCLNRIKDTSSQAKTSSKVERKKNMEMAFSVTKLIPKDSHVLLVDDIVTTGSTLLSCKKTLEKFGVTNISALTLADRERSPQNPWD